MKKLKSAFTGFVIATFVTAGAIACTQSLMSGLTGKTADHAIVAHGMSLNPGTLHWAPRAHLKG